MIDFKNIPLSSENIKKLLNYKTKVLLYPQLSEYKNIDELLYPYDNVVILYITKRGGKSIYGHWVCILKRGNVIEFFDSYGTKPDITLKHIDKITKKNNNEIYHYLSMLMKKSPYNLEYNEKKLQESKIGINTCGYYVVLRILLKDLSIDKFQKLFNIDNFENDDLVIYYLTKILY